MRTDFGTSPEQIDPERQMTDLGLDSVMPVKLRNRLEMATRTVLPAAVVLNHPTPIELAQQLRQRC